MTSSFIIVEQIDPPSNEPFRIIETFICSEGYRTRIVADRFATFERAQGEVEALKAALAKTLAALPTETAPDAPCEGCGNVEPIGPEFFSCCPDGPRQQTSPVPEAPWPPSARTNAMREGWKAFYEGRGRTVCPFPLSRHDLLRQYQTGWDAASKHNSEEFVKGAVKNDHQ